MGEERYAVREICAASGPARPMGCRTSDGLGRYDNLIVATGHAMIGVSLEPVTGALVAQLAAREPPMSDLAPLGPDRFASRARQARARPAS